MSSQRFPGKVLAPFHGRPLIDSVWTAVRAGVGEDVPIVVLTSEHASDEPLALYLAGTGRAVFRGPLDDVVERFRLALAVWPCQWVLRINADSPMLDPAIVRKVIAARSSDVDLVTTTFPRTFPKGQNVELLLATTLRGLDRELFDADDREHVTHYYYRNPGRFRILNIVSPDPALAADDMAVDTVEDLQKLERRSHRG
jgi:spore coat polysaccharide biosynthesis protein SpsF